MYVEHGLMLWRRKIGEECIRINFQERIPAPQETEIKETTYT
jgi:hypothetical protein